ncbi:hypothetical protein H4R26_001430 [Coemansia thaxteri]|uniref:Peptidase S1 domain-containing protein n=1 Tax=Coemansia thaxteri TaxID=2663907 RepID=A0A9W8BKT2_9FUNG|nr:hypothetical protein H4R26_001430 [Coemansia thaxteri]
MLPELEFNDNTKSIPIYSGPIDAGQNLLAMGWGLSDANATMLNLLRGAVVTTGDVAGCQQYNSEFDSSNGPQICTLGNLTPGDSTCSGDSGSSVVASRDGGVMLAGFDSIGIFAQGSGCGDPNTAHFYIHAAYFLDFITSITGISSDTLTQSATIEPSAGPTSSPASFERPPIRGIGTIGLPVERPRIF